jgi:hypothetical protein
MPDCRPRHSFACPNCNSLYELVKVEAGPEAVHRKVACRSCDAPLPGIEGNFVLKYFLLRKASWVTSLACSRPR